MKKFSLTDCEINKEYLVSKLIGDDALIKHITELGFINGTPIIILNKTKQGIIVKIRDSKLALGYDIAKNIVVCDLSNILDMQR